MAYTIGAAVCVSVILYVTLLFSESIGPNWMVSLLIDTVFTVDDSNEKSKSYATLKQNGGTLKKKYRFQNPCFPTNFVQFLRITRRCSVNQKDKMHLHDRDNVKTWRQFQIEFFRKNLMKSTQKLLTRFQWNFAQVRFAVLLCPLQMENFTQIRNKPTVSVITEKKGFIQ